MISFDQRRRELGIKSTGTVAERKADLGMTPNPIENRTMATAQENYTLQKIQEHADAVKEYEDWRKRARDYTGALDEYDFRKDTSLQAKYGSYDDYLQHKVGLKNDSQRRVGASIAYQQNLYKEESLNQRKAARKDDRVSEIERQIAELRSKASQMYITAQQEKDPTLRAMAYESRANAEDKIKKLEEDLHSLGGKTVADKMGDLGELIQASNETKLPLLLDQAELFFGNLENNISNKLFGKDINDQATLDATKKRVADIENALAESTAKALEGHTKLGQLALKGANAAYDMLGDVALSYAAGIPQAAGKVLPSLGAAANAANGAPTLLNATTKSQLVNRATQIGAKLLSDPVKGTTNAVISAKSGLSAYAKAIQADVDHELAARVGFETALAEYFSNKLFGGMLEDVPGEKGLVSQVASKIVDKIGLSDVASRFAGTTGGKIFSALLEKIGEGAEEVITGIADPLIEQIYNKDAKVDINELIDSFEVGVVMSTILGLPGDYANIMSGNAAKPTKIDITDFVNQATTESQQADEALRNAAIQTHGANAATGALNAPKTNATLTEAAGVPFTSANQQNAVLPETANGGIIEENAQGGVVNDGRTEEGGERRVQERQNADHVFRGYLSGTRRNFQEGKRTKTDYRDNRTDQVKAIKPSPTVANVIIEPEKDSVAYHIQNTLNEYGIQSFVVPHDVYETLGHGNAPAFEHIKADGTSTIYIDESATTDGSYIGGNYVEGASIALHEALHVMFDTGFAPANAIIDGLFSRLSDNGQQALDQISYDWDNTGTQSVKEFVCAFGSTYQIMLDRMENGLDVSQRRAFLDGLFADGTTAEQFYEEIAQIHDAWEAQLAPASRVSTQQANAEANALLNERDRENTPPSESSQINDLLSQMEQDREDGAAPTQTAPATAEEAPQQAQTEPAERLTDVDITSQQQSITDKFNEIQAKQAAISERLNTETDPIVQEALREQLNKLQRDAMQLAEQRNNTDVAAARDIELQAEKANLQSQLESEEDMARRSALQARIATIDAELGKRHGEAAEAGKPAPDDSEAPPPKFGKDKETSSNVFGNPNGTTFTSMTSSDAHKNGQIYVNNLGGPDATVQDKATALMSVLHWGTIEQNASLILYAMAQRDGDPELARQLLDRHRKERSKGGQAQSLGTASMSSGFRSDNVAVGMAKAISEKLDKKLKAAQDAYKKTGNAKAGKRVAKLEAAQKSVDAALEKSRAEISDIDSIYFSKAEDTERAALLRQKVLDIAEQRGHKLGDIGMSALDKMDVWHLYDTALASAVGLMSDGIPTGVMEGMNTIQSIAQLLNANTIERNIVGNFAFGALENAATDNLGHLIDTVFLSKAAARQRTTSEGDRRSSKYMVVTAKSKSLFSKAATSAAKSSAASSIARIQLDAPNGQMGKYNLNSYQSFGGLLGFAERALGYGMATTDAFQSAQSEGAVRGSLDSLVNNENSDMTGDVADFIANRKAEQRTWHRATALGEAASALGGALNVIGFGNNAGRTFTFNGHEYKMHDFGVGDFVMKYGRFAGNAIETTLEYTPYGAINAIYNLIVMREANAAVMRGESDRGFKTRNTKIGEAGLVNSLIGNAEKRSGYDRLTNEQAAIVAQSEAASAIARPLVGSAVIAAFGLLAKAGILLMNKSDDKDEMRDKQNAGLNSLQVNISALERLVTGKSTELQEGDLLMKCSDMPPFDTLAGVGWEIADKLDGEEDNGFLLVAGAALASGAAETISDLSVLDTINTYANDIKYRQTKDDDGNDLTVGQQARDAASKIAADRLSSAVTGMIWSPIKKTAAGIDPYSRDLTSDDYIGKVWNSFRNSVPGLRQTLPVKLDAHGNPVTTGIGVAPNVANKLLAPYDINRYHPTDVQQYSFEVGEYADKSAPNYYTVGEDRITLSAEDKRQWQTDYGKAFDSMAALLMNSANIDRLSAEEQKEIMSKINSYARATAKQKLLDRNGKEYEFSGKAAQMENVVDAEKQGIEFADWFLVKNKYDEIEENNAGSAYDKATEFANWLDNQSWISDTQENMLREQMKYGSGLSVNVGDTGYDALKTAGIGDNAAKNVYESINKLNDKYGDSVKEWQKDEAIVKLNISDADKLKAMQYYAAETTKDKLAQAVDEGFDLDTIVAFRQLRSEYSKKGERALNYSKYGLDQLDYMQLESLWG